MPGITTTLLLIVALGVSATGVNLATAGDMREIDKVEKELFKKSMSFDPSKDNSPPRTSYSGPDYSPPPSPPPATIENDATINNRVTRDTALRLARLIQSSGYSCDSISAVIPFNFSDGYHVTCNRYAYSYEAENRGGVWQVKVK